MCPVKTKSCDQVPHEPHTGGIPSPEFLDLLEKRKEVNVHITNRLAARPFWTCVESARTEPRIVAVVRYGLSVLHMGSTCHVRD